MFLKKIAAPSAESGVAIPDFAGCGGVFQEYKIVKLFVSFRISAS
jgi:hypothetical protein